MKLDSARAKLELMVVWAGLSPAERRLLLACARYLEKKEKLAS